MTKRQKYTELEFACECVFSKGGYSDPSTGQGDKRISLRFHYGTGSGDTRCYDRRDRVEDLGCDLSKSICINKQRLPQNSCLSYGCCRTRQ